MWWDSVQHQVLLYVWMMLLCAPLLSFITPALQSCLNCFLLLEEYFTWQFSQVQFIYFMHCRALHVIYTPVLLHMKNYCHVWFGKKFKGGGVGWSNIWLFTVDLHYKMHIMYSIIINDMVRMNSNFTEGILFVILFHRGAIPSPASILNI